MLSEHRHALHRIPELGWELPTLFEKTLAAMQSCEESIRNEMNA